MNNPGKTLAAKRPVHFTLVEILVVIAVMAILLSVLMPALFAAKNKARGLICLSNLKQFATAGIQYADDYNGHWLYTIGSWWPQNLAFRRLLNSKISRDAGINETTQICSHIMQYDLLCPNSAAVQKRTSDWVISLYSYGVANVNFGLKLASIAKPSERMQFIDATYNYPTKTTAEAPGHYVIDGENTAKANVAYRHGGMILGNLAFFDGHAATLHWSAVYQDAIWGN